MPIIHESICICTRCGNAWKKLVVLPIQCVHCGSRAWNRPRPPIHTLQPGQSVIIPWRNLANGRDIAANTRILKAAQVYARRHGWVLRMYPVTLGMEFFRKA